jgi:DNA-binding transcriptional MerR regulator
MGLKISDVSHHLGVNPQTLYFYERIGLIPSSQRTKSGSRLYSQEVVERLSFIQ